MNTDSSPLVVYCGFVHGNQIYRSYATRISLNSDLLYLYEHIRKQEKRTDLDTFQPIFWKFAQPQQRQYTGLLPDTVPAELDDLLSELVNVRQKGMHIAMTFPPIYKIRLNVATPNIQSLPMLPIYVPSHHDISLLSEGIFAKLRSSLGEFDVFKNQYSFMCMGIPLDQLSQGPLGSVWPDGWKDGSEIKIDVHIIPIPSTSISHVHDISSQPAWRSFLNLTTRVNKYASSTKCFLQVNKREHRVHEEDWPDLKKTMQKPVSLSSPYGGMLSEVLKPLSPVVKCETKTEEDTDKVMNTFFKSADKFPHNNFECLWSVEHHFSLLPRVQWEKRKGKLYRTEESFCRLVIFQLCALNIEMAFGNDGGFQCLIDQGLCDSKLSPLKMLVSKGSKDSNEAVTWAAQPDWAILRHGFPRLLCEICSDYAHYHDRERMLFLGTFLIRLAYRIYCSIGQMHTFKLIIPAIYIVDSVAEVYFLYTKPCTNDENVEVDGTGGAKTVDDSVVDVYYTTPMTFDLCSLHYRVRFVHFIYRFVQYMYENDDERVKQLVDSQMFKKYVAAVDKLGSLNEEKSRPSQSGSNDETVTSPSGSGSGGHFVSAGLVKLGYQLVDPHIDKRFYKNLPDKTSHVVLASKKSQRYVIRRCCKEEWNILKALPPHPNIIQVMDWDSVDYSIVMPFFQTYDGAIAAHLLRPYCHQVALQLLEAVQFLHKCGVAHRDIKPDNTVFDVGSRLNRAPVLKMIDFGLSNLFDPASESKQVIGIVGTPGYMAPEVSKHNSYDAFSADKYSTGAYISRLADICIDTTASKWLRVIASILMNPIATQRPDLDALLKPELRLVPQSSGRDVAFGVRGAGIAPIGV